MDLSRLCVGLAKDEEARSTEVLQAAARGDTSTLERLLIARANPNCRAVGTGQTPLHLVALRADSSPVAAVALLNAGANPMVEDADGKTPWHLAATTGCEAMRMEMLRPRKPLAGASSFTPPLPKSVEALLKSQSLTMHSEAAAVWCHLAGVQSALEFTSAPREYLEAMGFGKAALRRLEAARCRLGGGAVEGHLSVTGVAATGPEVDSEEQMAGSVLCEE